MVVNLLVILHVVSGFTALSIGTVIGFRRKADSLHRRLGIVFTYAMLVMAGTAIALSIIHPNVFLLVIAIGAGLLTVFGRASIRSKALARDRKWRRHIGLMGGALISAWTAFLVVNQIPLLPPLMSWIGPSIIGTAIIIRTIRKYVAASIVLLCLAWSASAQQPTMAPAPDSADISWLAQFRRPDVVIDWIAARYDSVSKTVVIDNIVIQWHDSLDASIKGHRAAKTFSCTPIGYLVDAMGDTVHVDYKGSRFEIVQKDGSQWVYRMTSNVLTSDVSNPIDGSLLLMINASKIIDRRYSVEGSASVTVEVH